MYYTRLMLEALMATFGAQVAGGTMVEMQAPTAANGWHQWLHISVPGDAPIFGTADLTRWKADGIPPYLVWMECDCAMGRRRIPCPHAAFAQITSPL